MGELRWNRALDGSQPFEHSGTRRHRNTTTGPSISPRTAPSSCSRSANPGGPGSSTSRPARARRRRSPSATSRTGNDWLAEHGTPESRSGRDPIRARRGSSAGSIRAHHTREVHRYEQPVESAARPAAVDDASSSRRWRCSSSASSVHSCHRPGPTRRARLSPPSTTPAGSVADRPTHRCPRNGGSSHLVNVEREREARLIDEAETARGSPGTAARSPTRGGPGDRRADGRPG